jgi:hypothetical protein
LETQIIDWKPAMQSYSLRFISSYECGRIVHFTAESDKDAEAIAQEQAKGSPAELWEGNRIVGALGSSPRSVDDARTPANSAH